jgi:regulator of G-protein signaling 3
MIYSGDLLLFDGLLWNRVGLSSLRVLIRYIAIVISTSAQVFAVLMSDLLLLTRPDQESYLSVMHDPVILHTIDHLNVNGSSGMLDASYCFVDFINSFISPTATEFSIVMSPTCGENALIFQAPTQELKSTWTHVLQQRTCASKAQLIIDNNLDNVV